MVGSEHWDWRRAWVMVGARVRGQWGREVRKVSHRWWKMIQRVRSKEGGEGCEARRDFWQETRIGQ